VKRVVLALTALSTVFVVALLGLVVVTGAVGSSTQVLSCVLENASTSGETNSTSTTFTPWERGCGAAAPTTLPNSPIVNNGLPPNYVIPVNATTVETVVITYALAQLGKPYLWGGSGPVAFDCSGLTMMAWAQAGVTLLHYTGDQINEGSPVTTYKEISPGDLVLVPGSDGTIVNPGHVGLYIGDGLVESAVDVQYGVIIQPYTVFVSGGLSGIRHLG
jgi:cell wall-associated NlpC family hydrolase